MSAFIHSALIALMLMMGAGVAGAMAQYRDPNLTDLSRPDGGFPPNSPRADRAFWDYMDRWNR